MHRCINWVKLMKEREILPQDGEVTIESVLTAND